MLERKKIQVRLINAYAYTLFLIFYVPFSFITAGVLAYRLNSNTIAFVVLGLTIIVPGVFPNVLRSKFVHQGEIEMDQDTFSIRFEKRSGHSFPTISDIISWNEVISFKTLESMKDDTSFLKFVLQGKNVKQYNFIESDSKTAVSTVKLVREFIKDYNASHPTQKIVQTPSFFASKLGRVAFKLLTGILLLSAIVISYINISALPFVLVPSLALYIVILAQMRNDKKALDEL